MRVAHVVIDISLCLLRVNISCVYYDIIVDNYIKEKHKMKLLTILFSLMFILGACGEEVIKKGVQQKDEYRYVEIEECTIPIAKKFKITNYGNKGLYLHNYVFEEKKDIFNKQYLISVNKRHEDDYIHMIESIDKMKNMTIVSETKKNHFKIIESTMDGDTMFHLYGVKSRIDLLVSNKKELNYLLDYCQKTWKLDKGEK